MDTQQWTAAPASADALTCVLADRVTHDGRAGAQQRAGAAAGSAGVKRGLQRAERSDRVRQDRRLRILGFRQLLLWPRHRKNETQRRG